MFYNEGKKCFKENLSMINPEADPLTYNLNSGLYNLLCAVEADTIKTQQYLSQIAKELKKISER
ncbi:MAG: hypothetical protein SCARUB_02346 [Candidatus Scalindua rubra]|uniref:Uncharacterized protein n=1 Tax=Candidatus Scalindua rubra TaxID=1872076 RepID=A0A1E3XA82_9BACT|nr:MAG: hypothetical protein SCARUB_02346 [Candidatus Scalindua rubra]